MEWKINIQDAIDFIDGNLEAELSLSKISSYIGYSEFYTSRKFKEITGNTLKRYIMLRKLTKAAIELRDKNIRIIDVAFQFGFQSQEAFTRSFYQAFGVNPGEYQTSIKPIPYFFKKDVLYPLHLSKKGAVIMVKDEQIRIRVEEVPAHNLYYLSRTGVDNYMDFWKQIEEEGQIDCDHMHGLLASIPGVFKEGFGAFTKDGYLFGKDSKDEIDGSKYSLKQQQIPTQKYLVFEHPGFTEEEFGDAVKQVRRVALEKFDFELNGYELDQSFVTAYEHSGMEECYYFIRIPIKSK